LAHDHPPNSLQAVRACVEAGVPRLEVDVRFLADDAMLVYHDHTLDGETNGYGPVDALDRSAAEALRYTHGGGATRLCFFEDVVAAIAGSETLLQVDLKLMRPISAARVKALAAALRPLDGNLLLGTEAHWNLRPFAELRVPVAFDPTLHIHYAPQRKGTGLTPSWMGVHGFWDDAPLAHIGHASAADYLAARTDDLGALVPAVRELMVDIPTVLRMADLGFELGHELARRGVELAVWTMRDRGAETTGPLARRLLDLGATTIIADEPEVIAGYLR
jgi:glycerophosphoryl diester phosphodiesterase